MYSGPLHLSRASRIDGAQVAQQWSVVGFSWLRLAPDIHCALGESLYRLAPLDRLQTSANDDQQNSICRSEPRAAPLHLSRASTISPYARSAVQQCHADAPD